MKYSARFELIEDYVRGGRGKIVLLAGVNANEQKALERQEKDNKATEVVFFDNKYTFAAKKDTMLQMPGIQKHYKKGAKITFYSNGGWTE